MAFQKNPTEDALPTEDEEKKRKNAQRVYETICEALNDLDFRYQHDEERLRVEFSVRGSELAIDMIIFVDPERQAVRLYSTLPFYAPDDNLSEMALAIAVTNVGLINGSFDYDIQDGEIRWRMTSSYNGSILGKEHFKYMIGVSIATVNSYNSRLLMIAKGMMTVEEFIAKENGE